VKLLIPIAHYDPRTGEIIYDEQERSIDYPKGAIRYPLYHRLDVTFAKRLNVGKFSMAPYLQILNVYNHKNPLLYEESSNYFVDLSGERFEYFLKPVNVPALPSIGVRFSF
jgi:hypothetical protein